MLNLETTTEITIVYLIAVKGLLERHILLLGSSGQNKSVPDLEKKTLN